AIAYHPPVALFALFVSYGVSGYVYTVWQMLKPQKKA
ncbi:MAG: CDP-diacylglycerol--serine O-phosphatidyltransferase, partial [Burkholderiales bacterium]|nr:CDP-diacylglycerol--serine O-phosphatidyltransferase [Burkholderiales bacterium]